jgi:Mg-chelatase subunit ChlD
MQHDFILLDRSQSMHTQWGEALAAVNGYVAKLAEDKVDTGVTLATFDAPAGKLVFEVIRDRIIPSTWRKVTDKEAQPRGNTPLNDATGQIVSLAKAGNYDRVAIIIMTDGEENASKELNVHQTKALLDECRAKGWQVIFLGANFDNAAQAASYNTAPSHMHSMTRGTFVGASASLASKRATYGVTGQAMTFTEEEKAELNRNATNATKT